jgi:phage baseplate assembly protein W
LSFDLQVLNGDLVISNSTGDLAIVQDTAKLEQDIIKILLTPVGGNTLNPWYGSLINKTIIGSVLSPQLQLSMAQSQIQSALENFQKLQGIQVQSGQPVSPAEQLASISQISITQSTIDPRAINIFVAVLNKAFGQVPVSFPMSQ